jgi:NitT/TauT family transport system substrate-binding protein
MQGLSRVTVLGVAALVLAGGASAGSVATSNDSTADTVVSQGLDPAPLAERTTITVSTAAKFESFSPLLLADALGELEKENISVEYAIMPSTEALPALAQGRTDMAAIGITAALFNGVAEGADLRIVYPGPTNNTVDGLWVRTAETSGALKEISTVGGSAGAATTAVVPIDAYLESVGSDITDIEFIKLPIEDLAFALKDGVVDSAWLNAPLHLAVQGTGLAEQVAAYEPKAFGSGYVMGPNLLRDRPEVGAAVVRAISRTAQTYLTGDYKADPETVATLAEVLGVTPAEVTSTPSLTFRPELDTTVFDQAQQIWLEIGDLLSYPTALERDQYTDTRFLDAVTAEG